ncbi:CAMK protein kinase, variant 1 [Aphanomyces astaci]|uniref:CAMK protein kinase, variant 1 n=1 Tax=Aphanomyces astaci TaxID=112090 RepID=W4GTR7_APHAT|nr:CAMK protein kinase, variant 1 [Aphanomyces astaci]ETV82716.1 CAMK protein kinase, variant 1 [Aphanomyces astaci]|eukprot:XP_009827392.1 CAMK protein kinase, variant 1 [Aphanomyces astaci]
MDEYTMEHVISKEPAKIVCQVLHKATSRRFAMKIYDTALMDVHRLNALRVELNTLLPINHPNLINVHDINVEDGLCYVVCDLEEGDDLFDVLLRKGRFSEDEAKALIKVLLETVRDCHALGMVHRNLKPESVWMPCSDDPTCLKLSNFGLAVSTSDDNAMTAVCGSPDYMAPEILANLQPPLASYGPQVDVWSLGVVAYVLLSGVFPFSGSTQTDLFDAIQAGILDMPDVSAPAKRFISNMLTVDPTQRATLDALLQHPWLQHVPKNIVTSDSSNAIETAGGAARRKFKAAAMTVQATLALKNHFCMPPPTLPMSQIVIPDEVAINKRHETLTMDAFLAAYDMADHHRQDMSLHDSGGVTARRYATASGVDVYLTFYSKEMMAFEDEVDLHAHVDILRQLTYHGNIANLHAFYSDCYEYCVAIEHVPNATDLFERVVDRGCPDEQEARQIMTRVLKAVEHCHDKGIIHRNIKLESVVVTAGVYSADTCVKLTNFGMATRADADVTLVCGSYDYIAPEVLDNIDAGDGGGCPYGVEVDIWSVGVLVFVLLGGYLPFHGPTQVELFQAIKTGHVQFDEPYWQHISKDAKDFICSMLVTNPRRRRSAKELLQHAWITSPTIVPLNQVEPKPSPAKQRFRTAALSVKAAVSFKLWTTFASKYSEVDQSTCVCTATGRVFALKKFTTGGPTTSTHVAVLTRLKQHLPEVAPVRDVFYEMDEVYVVEQDMQESGGDDLLFNRIVANDGYNEIDAVHIVTSLLHAVQKCHTVDVVHSNLTAENIWLQGGNNDEPPSIKLTNFGQTRHELLAGIEYAAPEVVTSQLCVHDSGDDKRHYDKPADVWSVGVVAFVLLCGYLPFHGRSGFDSFRRIKRGKVEFESPYWDHISSDAKAFISSALMVDPTARATVSDLVAHAWICDDGLLDNTKFVPLTNTVAKITLFNARRQLKAVIKVVRWCCSYVHNITWE